MGKAALVLLASLALVSSALTAQPVRAQDEATWTELRPGIVGTRPVEDGASFLTLNAPKRAEDAAIVPVDIQIRLPAGDPRKVTELILVVDENPAPVAATFRFGEGRSAFDLSTRLRVNSYSFIRAIAQTSDGQLHMTKAYVKASGGCSAPALKDPAEALAHLGEMRFRTFASRGEAQVQIRHPNYSGLQMDQVTRLYTPAWFVESLTLRQGERPLFSMEGGISISEDPTFRFTYAATGEPVTVEAKDTEGRRFKQTFPAGDGT